MHKKITNESYTIGKEEIDRMADHSRQQVLSAKAASDVIRDNINMIREAGLDHATQEILVREQTNQLSDIFKSMEQSCEEKQQRLNNYEQFRSDVEQVADDTRKVADMIGSATDKLSRIGLDLSNNVALRTANESRETWEDRQIELRESLKIAHEAVEKMRLGHVGWEKEE